MKNIELITKSGNLVGYTVIPVFHELPAFVTYGIRTFALDSAKLITPVYREAFGVVVTRELTGEPGMIGRVVL